MKSAEIDEDSAERRPVDAAQIAPNAPTIAQRWGSDRSDAIRQSNGGRCSNVDREAEQRRVDPPRIAAEPLDSLPEEGDGTSTRDRRRQAERGDGAGAPEGAAPSRGGGVMASRAVSTRSVATP